MYTMMLMMAVSGSGDVAALGHHRGGCHGGGYGCTGAYSACDYGSCGCTGYVYGGCYGGGCHGGGHGFLGHHRGGCNGGGHGFLGHHRGGCNGYVASSCGCWGSGYGYGYGCTGSYAPSCCGAAPVMSTGCTGAVMTGAPYGMPMYGAPPVMVAPGAAAGPVTMPP